MNKSLTIVIADDEWFICEMLKKLIHFEDLNMELVSIEHDGIALLTTIEAKKPDIVITDINMPRMDGLEVIQRTRETGNNCKFIVISGYRLFEYAYNALRYNVSDYLLKPVDEIELNNILEKIKVELESNLSEQEMKIISMRKYAVERGVDHELKNMDKSLRQINETYFLRFHEALFSFFYFKIDAPIDEEQKEDFTSITGKIMTLLECNLLDKCYDIPYVEKKDGVLGIINYEKENERNVMGAFERCFYAAKEVADRFSGVKITLAIGKKVNDIHLLSESKQSLFHACWMRMYLGTGRVIIDEEITGSVNISIINELQNLIDEMDKMLIALDIEGLENAINKLFAMPLQIIQTKEFMNCITKWIDSFSKNCEQIVKEEGYADEVHQMLSVSLNNTGTYEEYVRVLQGKVHQILEQIQNEIQGRTTKPIRLACAYIEKNYKEKISLEEVAEIVNLNPVYFCNLFKKSMGQTYTEYVTSIKIQKAKDFLKEGNMNINEISFELGFSDSRYFSKLFKKEVGIKPTDFRRIYG